MSSGHHKINMTDINTPILSQTTLNNVEIELNSTVNILEKKNSDSVPSSSVENISSNVFNSFNQDSQQSDNNVHSKILSNTNPSFIQPETMRECHVKLFAEDKGPKIYTIKGNSVTRPYITKNLPEVFKFMPVHGRPNRQESLAKFQENKIREFVGCTMNDEEYDKLAKYCSPDNLRNGKELIMPMSYPIFGLLPIEVMSRPQDKDNKLCVVKKHRLRVEKDQANHYAKKLKYRGLRLMPLAQEMDPNVITIGSLLEPGKDLLFRVRVYRPFLYNPKERIRRCRHTLFSSDVVLLGRHALTALRDRIVCANDVGMRFDVSRAPHHPPLTTAKELFPSSFLFINNTFYVDSRAGCADRSAGIRAWAQRRGLGELPCRDMAAARLHDLPLKLGHPEVFVHQGGCEHLLTFSEVRLVAAGDPLAPSLYPSQTAVSQLQTLYCTTCAEFGAKWIVTECPRVPFDPAFFCDTCFKLYLYRDGEKIGDFKAYMYRGNELNALKPGSYI